MMNWWQHMPQHIPQQGTQKGQQQGTQKVQQHGTQKGQQHGPQQGQQHMPQHGTQHGPQHGTQQMQQHGPQKGTHHGPQKGTHRHLIYAGYLSRRGEDMINRVASTTMVPTEEYERLKEMYEELLYAVESVIPGESRHATALRYIRQAERHDSTPQVNNTGDKP
jgi:hypothetical protein